MNILSILFAGLKPSGKPAVKVAGKFSLEFDSLFTAFLGEKNEKKLNHLRDFPPITGSLTGLTGGVDEFRFNSLERLKLPLRKLGAFSIYIRTLKQVSERKTGYKSGGKLNFKKERLSGWGQAAGMNKTVKAPKSLNKVLTFSDRKVPEQVELSKTVKNLKVQKAFLYRAARPLKVASSKIVIRSLSTLKHRRLSPEKGEQRSKERHALSFSPAAGFPVQGFPLPGDGRKADQRGAVSGSGFNLKREKEKVADGKVIQVRLEERRLLKKVLKGIKYTGASFKQNSGSGVKLQDGKGLPAVSAEAVKAEPVRPFALSPVSESFTLGGAGDKFNRIKTGGKSVLSTGRDESGKRSVSTLRYSVSKVEKREREESYNASFPPGKLLAPKGAVVDRSSPPPVHPFSSPVPNTGVPSQFSQEGHFSPNSSIHFVGSIFPTFSLNFGSNTTGNFSGGGSESSQSQPSGEANHSSSFQLSFSDRNLHLFVAVRGRTFNMNLNLFSGMQLDPSTLREIVSIVESSGFVPGRIVLKERKERYFYSGRAAESVELKV